MSEETQNPEAVTVTVTENVDKLVALVAEFQRDAAKFYTKKTASAAARARKSLSEFTKTAKVVRLEIQVQKRANSAEKKAKKAAQ